MAMTMAAVAKGVAHRRTALPIASATVILATALAAAVVTQEAREPAASTEMVSEASMPAPTTTTTEGGATHGAHQPELVTIGATRTGEAAVAVNLAVALRGGRRRGWAIRAAASEMTVSAAVVPPALPAAPGAGA